MDWNKFKEQNPGLETLEISYNGCGDSGNVEVETDFQGDFRNDLEGWAYNFLESRVGGWEIDSGSEGTINIDLRSNKIVWDHGNIVEETNWDHTEETLTE